MSRKDTIDDNASIHLSNNNTSVLFDDTNNNNTTLNDNLSDKLKKQGDKIDLFIEKFLESKKYKARSKQEIDFYKEMSKYVTHLKKSLQKLSDSYKEELELMAKKNEETKKNMIATLAHIRILK